MVALVWGCSFPPSVVPQRCGLPRKSSSRGTSGQSGRAVGVVATAAATVEGGQQLLQHVQLVGGGGDLLQLFVVVVDPWAPSQGDTQSIASQLFAASLFPYLGFLFHITRSNSSPKLTLFGFYFLLAFVAATIPAGIYAKVRYGTSLANVDWLHGGAESLLTFTNLFIVLGLRNAVRNVDKTIARDDANSEEQKL